MRNNLTWKIGGEAGFGIMSAGTILAKAYTRIGYSVIATNEYPSLIRGGHNVVSVRISNYPAYAPDRNLDILVALNKETVSIHKDELSDGALVIYDPKTGEWNAGDFPRKVVLLPVPFTEEVAKLGGETVMRNTYAIGATVAVLGSDFQILGDVIRDQFIKKGQKIVDENIAMAKAGYDYVKTSFAQVKDAFLDAATATEKTYVMNASEAVAFGALDGGVKFAAIYPMTPINSLITMFADHAAETGIVYKQPEDEIAGINMAIGASVAGARSMVATSGGGFALMVEGVSLAGILETPLVIDLGMRPGPATGMPTWTEQAELRMAIHAGHGDFPKIVLAPGDAAESYRLTKLAFELADKYQTPVIILTDKYLNESQWQIPASVFAGKSPINRGKFVTGNLPEGGSFKRYDLATDDGVSPRSIPGVAGGEYIANSYEHDEQGFTTEDAGMRFAMASKRMKKFDAMKKDILPPAVYGDLDSDLAFVAWGSLKGPVLEAMRLLKEKNVRSQLIHIPWLFPFPSEQFIKLAGKKRLVGIEGNASGQLMSLIRENTGIDIMQKFLKFDGRQWYPEEIVDLVMKG